MLQYYNYNAILKETKEKILRETKRREREQEQRIQLLQHLQFILAVYIHQQTNKQTAAAAAIEITIQRAQLNIIFFALLSRLFSFFFFFLSFSLFSRIYSFKRCRAISSPPHYTSKQTILKTSFFN